MSEISDAAASTRSAATAPPWQRRVASAIVAVVSQFLGLGLVFTGGASVLAGGAGDGAFGSADWLRISAGLVLIAISAATMVVSTCGVIIAASAEILISILALVIPFSIGSRDVHPVNWLRGVYVVVFPDGAEVAGLATASGFVLVLGCVCLAAALGHRERRRAGSRVSPLGRIIAMGAAVVLSIPGAALVWAGGHQLGVEYRVFASPDLSVGSVIMVFAGALLCAAVAAVSRLSAAALYAFGLFWVTMWVAFGVFLSAATPETVPIIPVWATTTAVVWCLCGFSAVLAVFLLTSGVVMRVVALSLRETSPTAEQAAQ
ncbi:hypothetical protein [Paramicrobacterium fandaimingii]|uniref:hypothetical protein n=1 Tax=Paramicrobacterium fandaimingii TaxID=2708079 RepID=UPI00142395D2|nr:hypothetical protein [Microbacterium fandaimingii]